MATVIAAWKLTLFCVFLFLQAFVTGLSSLVINASSVEVGYLWENPRLENVHTSEVVMDKEHSGSILRLICDITPPLLQDGEHWDKRDEIVKWYKTAPKAEPVKSVRYWSNDMSKTAISFSNITLDTLGTYSCIYGDVSASIDVLVENVEAAKGLKMPENLKELKSYVLYMKDKSGISGWTKQQQLLQPTGTTEYCSPLPRRFQQRPSSVHQLQVSDIKVIAAMGDAFTVGLGAQALSLNGYFTDFKGISWSIGGEGYLNQSTTLPNIIRQFNPLLKGASVTSQSRDNNPYNDDLNVAFVGASARDLENQAEDLVSRLKNMKNIDYENDWKLLTMWIGTEDLCQVCTDLDKLGPRSFIKYVMRTLNYLKEEVPHLFVNLVPPMDVSLLYELHGGSTKSCEIMGWSSCQCLKKGGEERDKISQAVKNYKHLLMELVSSGLYDTQNDFAVVIQPALQLPPKTKDGKLVKEFFGLDCLHFSAQGPCGSISSLMEKHVGAIWF
ncbi:phospholipase B1, membrane-associated-like isoform X3 [Porites lutea]|uniref:phospholipase B1, membrane-associated-like isoform X3 n=1 Tax=Porites lutea TaxID=51062 RepID=UPI003CC689E6